MHEVAAESTPSALRVRGPNGRRTSCCTIPSASRAPMSREFTVVRATRAHRTSRTGTVLNRSEPRTTMSITPPRISDRVVCQGKPQRPTELLRCRLKRFGPLPH